MKQEILNRLLNQKYESLARKEKDIILNQWLGLRSENPNSEHSKQLTEDLFKRFSEEDRNCISILYGCRDGFIIHRTFAPEYRKQFKIIITDKPVEEFVKEIPVKEKSGAILNLYKVLENTIGVKLKVRNAFKIGNKEKGLGVGILKIDAFEVIVAKDDNIEMVIEDMRDIFKLNQKMQNIESENFELRKEIQKLNQSSEPLIITEGKTDWKHYISALRYFHKNNEFQDVKENWFLKYGSEQDEIESVCGTNMSLNCSVPELNKILDSFIHSNKFSEGKSKGARIGIFDSDDNNAKLVNDSDSRTYSIIIQPKNISVELLYKKEELLTAFNGKRLFLGSEFDQRTKRHKNTKELNLGGNNNSLNKAGKNKIIDSDVYDNSGNNIALTKEVFAQKVFLEEVEISDDSWESFRHIFDRIQEIVV